MTTDSTLTVRLVVTDALLGGQPFIVPHEVASRLSVTRWQPTRRFGGAAGIVVRLTSSGTTISSLASAAQLLQLRPGCLAELTMDARDGVFSLVHCCGVHPARESPLPGQGHDHPVAESASINCATR